MREGENWAARGIARTEGIETSTWRTPRASPFRAARGIARTEGIETGGWQSQLLWLPTTPRAASPAPRALKRDFLQLRTRSNHAARGIARTEGIET